MSGAAWAWLGAAIVGLIAMFGVFELLTVAIGDPGETVGSPDGKAFWPREIRAIEAGEGGLAGSTFGRGR